jgi:hypothetical protein
VTPLADQGFIVFDRDPATLRWAEAAHRVAVERAARPDVQAQNLRHGNTWFVGVDALPNDPDGSVDDVPLCGPWQRYVTAPPQWHRAQLSIVYPEYPRQDAGESAANHAFRIRRYAAHVDGLLPVGADRRRYMQEAHGFILGLALNYATAAPLMVWPRSHHVMGAAFRTHIGTGDPRRCDLTDVYHSARRRVFDSITPVAVVIEPGQAVLLHRHLLHGVRPWAATDSAPPEGRMIAYFRPEVSDTAWVSPP